MKVKDLIEILSKLDQEKEVKIVEASGYEYDEETKSDFQILNYETDCKEKIRDGSFYYYIYDCSDNKDFYVLR